MFSAFKSALGLQASLPFTVGAEQTSFGERSSLWKLHEGRDSRTGNPVSVFKSTSTEDKPVKNALLRLKKTRHPNVLGFVAEGEKSSPKELLIATEAVVPLLDWLKLERQKVIDSSDPEKGTQTLQLHCLWGLSQILSALAFLNMDCNKVDF